ncbi:MAG: YqgE/AlgH family protein [Alphaproteobacteria bacterium]
MAKLMNELPIPSQRKGPNQDFLGGQLLVAMPSMNDPRFERSVIFMCSHSPKGAMGLIVNKPATHITFPELLVQLSIDHPQQDQEIPINMGGPVEPGRGFVLHTSEDFVSDSTLRVTPEISLTATIDVLRAIAAGKGPRNALLALGYAGWGPGQLETEILANGWLHCSVDEELLYNTDLDSKWLRAIHKIGISPHLLSGQAGHA